MRLGLDSFPEFGVPSARAGTILVHLVLFGAILVLFGARAALKASTLVVPWQAAAARMALGARHRSSASRGSRGLRTK